MRQAMLARAKVLGCTFDIPRDTWIEPPEFNGISEAQRDELQDLLAQAGIDVMTYCEDQGIDSLLGIEAQHFENVKAHIINTTQGQGKAIA